MKPLPPLPKLSRRLEAIKHTIHSDYTHIWDCCCDHGQLGMALVKSNAAPHIHFVDIVPQIIDKVQAKLLFHFPNQAGSEHQDTSQWHTHCADVSELPIHRFDQAKDQRHLVIIAGVGGDLTQECVETLYKNNPLRSIDFLLCPVRHLYALRSSLHRLNFGLVSESLIEENKRIYEVILTRPQTQTAHNDPRIHPLGSALWQTNEPTNSALSHRYLLQQIKHYRHRENTDNTEVSHILKQLRAIETLLSR